MRERKGTPDGENIKWPIFVNFVAMGQLVATYLVLQRDIDHLGFLPLRFNNLRVRFRWEQYAP